MSATARWNVVDLAIAAVVASTVAIGVAGYRRFQSPFPQISAVVPAHVMAGVPHQLSVRGRYLHPYLRVFVSASGRAPALDPSTSSKREAPVVTTTASEIVVTLPPVPPGTYDLYLFDEFEGVALVSHPLTVDAPDYARAELTATVRFFVAAPGLAALLAPGDRDQSPSVDRTAPATEPATVTAVRVDPVLHPQFEMRMAYGDTDAVWIGGRGALQQVDVDLHVPLVKYTSDEWRYNGAPVRAGQLMDFETARFKSRGTLIAVGDPHPLGPQAPRP